jgi:hypothetical protein
VYFRVLIGDTTDLWTMLGTDNTLGKNKWCDEYTKNEQFVFVQGL